MKIKLWIAALVLLRSFVFAQDITGTWQGMLAMGQQHAHVILKIEKANDGGLRGKLYMPDVSPDFLDWGAFTPLDSITLQGMDLKFAVPYRSNSSFAGKVSADGICQRCADCASGSIAACQT